MRLPRRVPWASIAELDEVCTWIYSDEADHRLKRAALNRLAAWRVSTALPHALESAWLILSAILQDTEASRANPGASSFVYLRQTYALSIIRLVNGLVDPLQQGTYARPIGAIAAQIGLPVWLVEIRHAATHEDLPSLETLREASSQAMIWLLHNYFLPTISPLNPADVSPPEIPPLLPLLKEYKTLLKLATRDASLKTRSKTDILRLHRQLERWLGEIKVAWGIGFGQHGYDDEKERWAIDQLCFEFLNKGGIIPVSKKKRIEGDLSNLSIPPNIDLWEQMLLHVQSNHSTFGSQLLSHVVGRLVSSDGEDSSFDACLSGWILWIVQTWGESQVECAAEEAIAVILAELGRTDPDRLMVARIRPLIQALSASDLELQGKIESLVQARMASVTQPSAEELTLEMMEERLAMLKSRLSATPPDAVMEDVRTPAHGIKNPASGIRLLGEEDGWKPCPIGMDPRVPDRR